MSLSQFLNSAELQIENGAQRAELTRVLRDLAELKPEELAKKLYADYEGTRERRRPHRYYELTFAHARLHQLWPS